MSKESSTVFKAWEATVRKTQAAKKRAHSLFGLSERDNISDHDEEQTSEDSDYDSEDIIYNADKIVGNGEYYTGQWCENLPHGQGKYFWKDGCIYIGQWFKGKCMGKGRFSWPFGATYEGEFKSGYMDGNGTYVCANGDTYKGEWVMNLKHGHGTKIYFNEDQYEGEWRRGLQEGHGKYQWKNGNYYDGEWKNGEMCGTGTFVWSNGNMYEGNWEEGMPKGNGNFKWSDGTLYTGNWSKDLSKQNVTCYPSQSSTSSSDANLEWNPQDIYTNDLKECKTCPVEEVLILPSQKKLAVWMSSKGNGVKPPRRMSVDGRASVGLERPLDRMKMWDSDDARASNACKDQLDNQHLVEEKGQMKIYKACKRQGETISKGHKNYELMLNLQLGIRHSVGRPGPSGTHDLKPSAFDPREKYWTRFPPEGSKYTPPHQSCEFKWKDYCPLVFRTLRQLFKVDAADYMLSICGDDALRELSSPGKSGSFFYLTNDDRYMIKTMKKSEVKVLVRMLCAYYNHVRTYDNTLVTKFYGLHCVRLTGQPIQKKVRFIVMGNLFCSKYTIHRRFDLKGSSLGRTTNDAEIDEMTILKDLDLNFIFRLQKSWFQEFCRQLDKDCEFLEQERIMDYSLLVGLHFRNISATGDLIPYGALTQNAKNEGDENHTLTQEDMDQSISNSSRGASIKLGLNMPARVERTERNNDCEFQLVGEPTGEYYEVIMFFGIIDILQDYDISKKLEHAYKSFQYDPTSISAVDPRQYSRRFRDFIFRVIDEDTP